MGFEPFIIPKREQKQPEGSREDRVTALAKLLHQRGLTSSMTDALRLAEGMVEVERKVIKQKPKEELPAPIIEKSSVHTESFGLRLPPDFQHFVTQAAALTHEPVSNPAPASAAEEPMRFGREMEHTIAQVPHIAAHKQVMFEDAPSRKPDETVTDMQVTTGDGGIKATRTETTASSQTVEEVAIIEAPSAAELLAEADAPAEAPQRDLAKEHGVDLFNMFKVNK